MTENVDGPLVWRDDEDRGWCLVVFSQDDRAILRAAAAALGGPANGPGTLETEGQRLAGRLLELAELACE